MCLPAVRLCGSRSPPSPRKRLSSFFLRVSAREQKSLGVAVLLVASFAAGRWRRHLWPRLIWGCYQDLCARLNAHFSDSLSKRRS